MKCVVFYALLRSQKSRYFFPSMSIVRPKVSQGNYTPACLFYRHIFTVLNYFLSILDTITLATCNS